ncbi:MAG: phosphotransferase [Armatimonas sp.]
MDNAGNGRRGLRATPSAELLTAIQVSYNLDPIHEIQDLGGSSSLNLLVTRGAERYIARVYRPYTCTNRLNAMQSVRHTLLHGGIPCPEILTTPYGATWIRFEGRLIEVEAFVEHDANMDTWERLETGLPWLGRIHSILRHYSVNAAGKTPLFANHIEPTNTLEGMEKTVRRVAAWPPSPEEHQILDVGMILVERLAEAEQEYLPLLVRQLTHGDFWDNNVFFQSGQVVLITDLDFMGERARIDDLALTLYYASASIANFSECRDRLRRLIEAYNSELAEPLTIAERAALPLALARQPLWWLAGWFPALDDDSLARRGFAEMLPEIQWSLEIMDHLEQWQAAFGA